MTIRLRIAPSPSGSPHIGLVRSALYNFAWAKKMGGQFILRIEDTDAARSTEESESAIIDALRWVGLDWNEGIGKGGTVGPYKQSERKDLYRHYAEKLIAEGKAYRCYCSQEDLIASREVHEKSGAKAGWKYPRTCIGVKDDSSRPHVVRFIAKTDGITTYEDLIFGHMEMSNTENQDWILLRSDNLPLYNWGATVDDGLQGITLVARGRDHGPNTFQQVLMYEALGWKLPTFAHMGLLRSQTNEKLSKRHAAVSVAEYRDKGYSPGAILNYLARLGWSKGNMEVFGLDEFIEVFDWSNCVKNDAKFDPEKFAAINYAHLKSEKLTPNAAYAHGVLPFLYKAGIEGVSHKQVEAAIHTVRPRAHTFLEAANMLEFFFRPELAIDPAVATQFLSPAIKPKLQGVYKVLNETAQWDETTLKANINAWLADMKMPISEIGQSLRVAITGKTQSPDLFAVISVLGKETTLKRLSRQL
jgi:glutamyl-tRNA synthetase